MYFTCGQEGSTNDGSIYKDSDFKKMLDRGEIRFPRVSAADKLQVPYHIVGDDGFELSKTVMKVNKLLSILLDYITMALSQFCDGNVIDIKKISAICLLN